MATVASLFHHNTPSGTVHNDRVVAQDRVGIEIELEGFDLDESYRVRGWRVTGDGSLRDGGLEFVFDGPAGGNALVSRLDNFGEFIADYDPVCSERTSLHVHLDVRDMQWEDVWTLLVLYSIIEPYMFHICGWHRADNIYSLALFKGESQLRGIREIRDERNHHLVTHEDMFTKYAALNVSALNNFGSLEFRGHEGTYDTDQILLWVNIILSLKKYVLAYEGKPEEFPKMMSAMGAEGFLREVFGDLVDDKVPHNVSDMLYQGAMIAEDIVFAKNLRASRQKIRRAFKGSKLKNVFQEKYQPPANRQRDTRRRPNREQVYRALVETYERDDLRVRTSSDVLRYASANNILEIIPDDRIVPIGILDEVLQRVDRNPSAQWRAQNTWGEVLPPISEEV